MLLTEKRYYIMNVGDSRAYQLKEKMKQLTTDQTFVADADAAGGALTIQDLRRSLVRVEKPLVARQNGVDLSFLPPPADGGLGMAARYLSNGKVIYANQVVAGWRHLNKGQGVRLSAFEPRKMRRKASLCTSLYYDVAEKISLKIIM